MTQFLILNTFKKIKDDRKDYTVFKSGEEYSLDALNAYFNEKAIKCLIETNYIQIHKQEVPLVENTPIDTQTPQEEVATKPVELEIETPTFEIMYKTTQPIQDKDGNEIEVGSQFTESELKEIIAQDKRQSKKKIKDLLEEQKLMEVKKL